MSYFNKIDYVTSAPPLYPFERTTPKYEDYIRHCPAPHLAADYPIPTDKVVHLRVPTTVDGGGAGSFRTICKLPASAPGWRISLHGAGENISDAAGWSICAACTQSGYVRLRVLLSQAKGAELTRVALWTTGATRKKKRAGRYENDGTFKDRALKRLDDKWWVYP